MIVRLEGMKLEHHAAGKDYDAYDKLVLFTSRVPDAGDNGEIVGRVTHEYGMKLDTQARIDLATLLRVVDPGTEINLDVRVNGRFETICGFSEA